MKLKRSFGKLIIYSYKTSIFRPKHRDGKITFEFSETLKINYYSHE
jgi:hypothetical protein